ncbi:hypothetical protein BWI96_11755 [Siphonobacter sp. SORGH_AS_0500]|uniref:tyrosine-type recombinase/integrase n=1 Tax=Siphonobacter sp. SORGH_AS_0500 TaxID=1864824 RepID=UPI000CBAB163|nr:site-specific integrase [Siphonobacter sp. SORGH_AS_0500]PKK36523.1 hypothetical protein BWI96_11755 [Siphonobacter sp. SORGH_AS_0500]
MNTTKAEIKLAFDPSSNGKISVKLRVIFQRENRKYSFPIKGGVFLTKEDFDKLVRCYEGGYGKSAERIRHIYDSLEPFIKKAKEVVDKLPVFSFDVFKEAFYRTDSVVEDFDKTDLLLAISRKADSMRKQGRVGNATAYDAAGRSLARYVSSLSKADRQDLGLAALPKKAASPVITLTYKEVTPELLADYEGWMKRYGKSSQSPSGKPSPASSTTIGIYLRHVRSMFNDAIDDGIISKDVYPFGKKRYVIPAGKNTKKALDKADIDKIMAYECAPGMEQRSRDLWAFSYYSNGMNFADILHLRWKDIDKKKNKIVFIRKKTARTRKADQLKIQAMLFEESWAIIKRWKNTDNRPDAYVFPFLEETMDAIRQRAIIRQVIKVTNKYMTKIAEAVGVEGDVKTYAARHSFATILLRSEAPIAFISQSLGHANIATTEAYLGSFDDEKTKKYLEALM